MITYAIAVINEDNYMPSGVSIATTNSIITAKRYLCKQYYSCIDQVSSMEDLEMLKEYIDAKVNNAELEWRDTKTGDIFSSNIIITETSNADEIMKK